MVYFRGEKIGEGHGSSIQQGEKYAARKALEKYYFPQREWQQYYIKSKEQKYNNKKHVKSEPGAMPPPMGQQWNASKVRYNRKKDKKHMQISEKRTAARTRAAEVEL